MEAREATATGESCMRVDGHDILTIMLWRACVMRNMYVALSHMVMP
mgnify:CR=1 FL=1